MNEFLPWQLPYTKICKIQEPLVTDNTFTPKNSCIYCNEHVVGVSIQYLNIFRSHASCVNFHLKMK